MEIVVCEEMVTLFPYGSHVDVGRNSGKEPENFTGVACKKKGGSFSALIFRSAFILCFLYFQVRR